MDEIRITAPAPGLCPVCATRHDETKPHDRDSLYYQNQFYRENKRFPTWEDAMAHCAPATQAAWRKKLAKRGIVLKEPISNGDKQMEGHRHLPGGG